MTDRYAADRYAVIGNPIAQSKSPIIHAAFAKATAQDLTYERIEGQLGQFAQSVDTFRAVGGRGMNVTAPFKLDAFAYATDRSERAQLAGAVNALKFEGDRVIAENFDGIGLVRDLEVNLRSPLKGKRVLVLGAGGATRGALLPLLEAQPALLFVANRTTDKAKQLIAPYLGFGVVNAGGFDDLRDQQFDVVLNATSSSLSSSESPVSGALLANAYAPDALAYDLSYGKGLTPFLKQAKAANVARLADGVGMLVEQAAEAFFWWRRVRPDTRGVIETISVPLI
jgi:shikimate dehydrogenase